MRLSNMDSGVDVKRLFLKTHYNELFINEIYKTSDSNEYKENLYEPSRFKNNSLLVNTSIILIIFLFPLYVLACVIITLYIISKFKHRVISSKRIFLHFSIALPHVVKNTDLDSDYSDWLTITYRRNTGVQLKNQYSIYNIITVDDIINSAKNSIITFYLSLSKFGRKVVFFQLKSYQWFIVYNACLKIPIDSEIVFCNHKDRWALLIDNLPIKQKILLQHGTEVINHMPMYSNARLIKYNKKDNFWYYNFPTKYKTISRLYAFSEKEFKAMCKSVVDNKPEKLIVGYNLKTNKINNNKITVLIIGFFRNYYKEEELLLKSLQGLDVNLFLKNHPTVSSDCYKTLRKKYKFEFIDTPFFPDAEIVISYNSTLALEYQSLGATILYYNNFKMHEIRSIVENFIYMNEQKFKTI